MTQLERAGLEALKRTVGEQRAARLSYAYRDRDPARDRGIHLRARTETVGVRVDALMNCGTSTADSDASSSGTAPAWPIWTSRSCEPSTPSA